MEKISISGSGSGPGNIDRAIWVRARMHLAPSSALSLQGAHNPVVTRQQWLRQHVREISSKVECKSGAIREKRTRAIQKIPFQGMGFRFYERILRVLNKKEKVIHLKTLFSRYKSLLFTMKPCRIPRDSIF